MQQQILQLAECLKKTPQTFPAYVDYINLVEVVTRCFFKVKSVGLAGWLSWLERCIHIAEVGGSNPSPATMAIVFVLAWTLSVLFSVYTVFSTSTSFSVLIADRDLLINFFQRMAGLLAFNFLFFQVLIGSRMKYMRSNVGEWVFKFHHLEGTLAFILVITHPTLFVIFNYSLSHKLDPFYVFTDFCALCSKPVDYFYTLGRISFWLIVFAVFAAKFRSNSLIRKHWRKVHSLNYIAFFLVAIHAYFVGRDVQVKPFIYLFYFYVSVAAILVITKIYFFFREKKLS